MSAPRPSVTRFATRQNSRIAYDPGAPAGAASPPVVLLHDLLAGRAVWNPFRAVLANRHRLIVPDARGHGASATLANQWYTVAELAADLLAVLDAEQILAAHLVGHGLGTATAFEVALRQPTRVCSLTLIAPPLFSLLDNHADPLVRSARLELRTGDRAAADAAYKGLIDKALDTYLIPRRGPNWRESLTKPQLGAVRRQAAALTALLPALDAYVVDREATRTLNLRTMIVSDTEESTVHRQTSQSLADLIPGSRIAHLGLHQDQAPTELARLVLAFIDADEG